MGATDPVLFVRTGMAANQAVELARQIDSLTGPNVSWLIGIGFAPRCATEIARQIVEVEPDTGLLMNVGIPDLQALEIAAAITRTQRIVGTGGQLPDGLLASAGKLTMIARLPTFFGGPINQMWASADNWYLGGFATVVIPSVPRTIEGIAWEDDVTGEIVPLRYSGSLSKVLAPGDADICTDRVNIVRPRSRKGWWRVRSSIPSDAGHIYGQNVNSVNIPGAGMWYYNPADGDIDQTYIPGPLTKPNVNASAFQYAYGPTMHLGRYSSPGYPSVWGFGQSNMFGNGDTNWVDTGQSHFNRMAMANGVAQDIIAIAKAAHGGGTAENFAANTRLLAKLKYANTLYTILANTGIILGETPAQEMIYNHTMWAAARSARVEKIVVCDNWPVTSSTNEFEDAAGQDYDPFFGPGEAADQLDDLLDLSVDTPTGPDMVFNMTSARDPNDPNKWGTNGTPFFNTGDGTHQNEHSATTIGDELRSAVQSLRFK